MSKETVKAFYEAACKDTAIQEEIKGLGENFQGIQEDAVKKLIKFAASKGYEFNAADIKDFEKTQTQQLSPEELDKINAGDAFCIFVGAGTYTLGAKGGNSALHCVKVGTGFGQGFQK